jgi:hypothetical protein
MSEWRSLNNGAPRDFDVRLPVLGSIVSVDRATLSPLGAGCESLPNDLRDFTEVSGRSEQRTSGALYRSILSGRRAAAPWCENLALSRGQAIVCTSFFTRHERRPRGIRPHWGANSVLVATCLRRSRGGRTTADQTFRAGAAVSVAGLGPEARRRGSLIGECTTPPAPPTRSALLRRRRG